MDAGMQLGVKQIHVPKLIQIGKCRHRYGPLNIARCNINYISVLIHMRYYVMGIIALLQMSLDSYDLLFAITVLGAVQHDQYS